MSSLVIGCLLFGMGLAVLAYLIATAPHGAETPEGFCLLSDDHAEQDRAELSGAGAGETFFHTGTSNDA